MSEHLQSHDRASEEPLSNYDRLPLVAQERFDAEEHKRREDNAAYDAAQARDAANREVVADAQIELRAIENHPNATPAQIKRAEAKVAKAEQKFLDGQAKGPKGRSRFNDVHEFVQANRGPFKECAVADTAIDGKSSKDMLNVRRNELAMNRADVKILDSHLLPRDMIDAKANANVAQLVRAPSVAGIRRLRIAFDGTRTQGNVEWPQRGVFNGLGYEDRIDLEGVFFWMFEKEIKAKLIGEALKDHQPSEAMQMSERREQYAALEVERMRLIRLCEYWFRRCEDAGVEVERSWPFEPMAFLGIEPV